MRKIVSLILLASLLLVCFSGCSIANNTNGEKNQNQDTTNNTNNDKEQNQDTTPNTNNSENNIPVIIEGELDKGSDLIATLVAYLEQYLTNYDLIGRTFAQKIDDIKNGIQPLHVAFDPSDYYFVCGYYNPAEDHYEFGYCCAEDYTWVGYKNETEILEYYNDTKWAVVFQINRASSIADIISKENAVPNMEHFQIYTPTFENGVNIAAPVVFDETFIYLNYPNCYLNRSSQNTSTMYYCKSIYYHPMNTIPCVYLDGEYYLSFYLYTVYSDGLRGEENNYAYSFGMYYDTLMDIMEKEKYHTIDEYERTSFYGTISFADFLNGVLK